MLSIARALGSKYSANAKNKLNYTSANIYTLLCYTGIATVIPINNIIIREKNITTITCDSFGYPPPTIVWSRSNGALSDRVSVSNSVSVSTGNGNVTRVSVNLTITNVSREDTGVYTCSANNSIGSDSRNVSITVQCKFVLLAMCFMHINFCFLIN